MGMRVWEVVISTVEKELVKSTGILGYQIGGHCLGEAICKRKAAFWWGSAGRGV